MDRFDAEKGLFHFVFANGEDYYYTNSFMRLTLYQYLYCQLIRKGYRSVFFFCGDEGNYQLSMVDTDFYAVSEKQDSFLGRIKLFHRNGKASSFSNKVSINGKSNFEDCLKRMLTIMQEKEHIAFVFSIETFKDIAEFQNIILALKEMSDKNQRAGNRHLVLIHAPVIAGGSLPYFKDKNGIFCSDLFPEIKRIYKKCKNIHIYDELQNELGDRVSFLNVIKREYIYSILFRFFLKYDSCFSDNFSYIDDYVDFIWMWYNSQSFREYIGAIFPNNHKVMLLDIEKSLENKSVFAKITENVKHLREKAGNVISLKTWLEMCGYKTELPTTPIYDYNSNVIKLQKVYKILCENKTENIEENTKKLLFQIIEVLQKPSLILFDDHCSTMYLEKYIEYALEACEKPVKIDVLTIEKAVKAIKYTVDRLFSAKFNDELQLEEENNDYKISDSCYELHTGIIKTVGQIYILEAENKALDHKIAKLEREFEEALNDERRFEKMNKRAVEEERQIAYTQKVSTEVKELINKKERALNLNNIIKSNKLVRTQKQEWLEKLKSTVRTMETTLEMSFADGSQNIGKSVDITLQQTKDKLVETNNLLREISDKSEVFNDTIEEANSRLNNNKMMSIADVDRQYDELVRNMEMTEYNNKEFEEAVQVYD
ncbi:MAG: DUF948 domain-containing protein [Acutalibacteraceae bacterium]|nr:DUF948 domain-containing protein [Acutalibacteraceae bacterium]